MFGQLRCSFCRKREDQVQKLVAGPHVFICDSCVKIASDIMEHSGPDRPATENNVRRLLRRLWNRFVGSFRIRFA